LHGYWQTATNDERRLSKTKAKSESDVNEAENPSDIGFAKSCGNPTTFVFELCHITTINICQLASSVLAPPRQLQQSAGGLRKRFFPAIKLVKLMAECSQAHWHHPANTIKPSICGSDAALCQVTLTTCYGRPM